MPITMQLVYDILGKLEAFSIYRWRIFFFWGGREIIVCICIYVCKTGRGHSFGATIFLTILTDGVE